jgi:predicted metalloprotease with PDZ domain
LEYLPSHIQILIMNKKSFTGIIFLLICFTAWAQHPFRHPTEAVEIRFDRQQPVINYILTVDTADLFSYTVEMRIRNIPDTFRVAMFAHPEYDDRYWRFIEHLNVESKTGRSDVLREDSALWRIITTGSEAIIHYRIHLPPQQQPLRPAWRPFLSSTGALVGGPHSFMYVIGAELAPSYVTLHIPNTWQVGTGLEPTADPQTFFAPTVRVLVDGPILIGFFRSWSFTLDGVPHRVIYWPLRNSIAFDSARFVSDVKKIVEQTALLFGRLPYREYSFMFQDGAYGALEHLNSVTVGIPGSELAKDITSYYSTIAHEFFHTWNLMRIRPVEHGDVTYKTPPPSRGLWWSEGVTLFYADLMMRRAGLHTHDSTRKIHLESLLARYFGSPGDMHISPEKVSLVADGPPGKLGDYTASTHLQGELIGTMLDIIIRDATNGKHSMDDVMRKMFERFSGERGFSGSDIEKIVASVCGCDMHSFFKDYVSGNKTIAFDKYFQLLGLHTSLSLTEEVDEQGKPIPDLRVYAWQPLYESIPLLGITDPSSCWGKAGLHTGDQILTVNGNNMKTAADFRQLIRVLKISDNLSVEVRQPKGVWKTNVLISGYSQPSVKLSEMPMATAKQRRLYAEWNLGN